MIVLCGFRNTNYLDFLLFVDFYLLQLHTAKCRKRVEVELNVFLFFCCFFLALKRGCYLVTRCCSGVFARCYDASLSLITRIPGGALAAALGPGAPSFITSQPTTAAEAVSHPAQLRNRTQSGVHKYSLKGHQAAWGGRILLIQALHSRPHPRFIYKSPLSHMDEVIDSVISRQPALRVRLRDKT